MSGYSVSAQPPAGDPIIVQHLAANERIPNSITDFIFDATGILWIAPDNDNIRMYDGTNVRVLETPFARGIPQFQFSRVLLDEYGAPCFVSLDNQYLFRLNQASQLSEDSLSTASLSHIYNKGDHFFDWNAFLSAAPDPIKKAHLEDLKKLAGDNNTFVSFNDSAFAFTLADTLCVYLHGNLRRIDISRSSGGNFFFVDDRVFILFSDGFRVLNDRSSAILPVRFGGDILQDTFFLANKGIPPLRLFRSEFPHVLCGTRLYRLEYRNDSLLSTIFVGDLGFIHNAITKVAYQPMLGISAVATRDDGLYILRSNPFYSRRFDDPFLKMKRKMIYFPVTVLGKDSFFTAWSKFTGNGGYRLLDLAHEGPRTLFATRTGDIWEGSKNRIARYDRSMVKQWEMPVPPPNRGVVDFCEAEPGDLYCLTDKSIFRYEEGAFVDKHPLTDRPHEDILFQQLCYLGKGIFWLAANKGIYRYDRQANSLQRVPDIPDVFTLNILKLSGGSILVTCYPESFYFLYYKDRFFKIPVESDLPLKETSSVLEDRKGRIWFATTSGFFVTTEKEIEKWCDGLTRAVYYYRYGRSEGLQDLELNGGLNRSNALSAEGYLVFNSMGGVTVFHQDSLREVFPTTPIRIARRGKLGEEYVASDSIGLPHDNEGMVVQVRVPYYGSRDNLQIEYLLSPGQQEWKDVDPLGRISLGHLVHGSYHLSIRVRSGLDPDDYRTRSVVVTVPYLFYETLAFRLTAGAILLLVCSLVTTSIIRLRREVRLKNIRLHEQNLQLQSALGNLEENMALKEKLITLVLHDLKTPLYFQSLLFSQIVEKDYFKNDEAFQLFHDLRNSSTAILQFTKEFLTWYSSQREGFQVRNEEFDHKRIVDDLFSVYADIAERKRLQLQYRNNGVDTLYTDRNILEIIIRNLLDNAIKYTEHGSVSVDFQRLDGSDSITISDTGSGMRPEKIAQLEQYADTSGKNAAPTFGYRFIYTMAEKIGAVIRIGSTPGKGSSISIILPAQKNRGYVETNPLS